VRVGIRGTNDVAWVGRCTNTSAKLASLSEPDRVRVTRTVYKRLNDDRKYSNGRHMWSDEQCARWRRQRPALNVEALELVGLVAEVTPGVRHSLSRRADPDTPNWTGRPPPHPTESVAARMQTWFAQCLVPPTHRSIMRRRSTGGERIIFRSGRYGRLCFAHRGEPRSRDPRMRCQRRRTPSTSSDSAR
jgi:hypothetical protein